MRATIELRAMSGAAWLLLLVATGCASSEAARGAHSAADARSDARSGARAAAGPAARRGTTTIAAGEEPDDLPADPNEAAAAEGAPASAEPNEPAGASSEAKASLPQTPDERQRVCALLLAQSKSASSVDLVAHLAIAKRYANDSARASNPEYLSHEHALYETLQKSLPKRSLRASIGPSEGDATVRLSLTNEGVKVLCESTLVDRVSETQRGGLSVL